MVKRVETIRLRQLSYFVVAAEQGAFRKASHALGVQESTISRAIRDLEDELGASLLHRHNNGVCLTVAGERFLRRVRIIFEQIREGLEEVAAVGRCESGCISVGLFSSLASGFLADLLRSYGDGHAGVRVDFLEGNPAKHIAAIRKLELDVAFIAGVSNLPDCETDILWFERVFAVIPECHKLAQAQSLVWSDFYNERFIFSEMTLGPEIHALLKNRLPVLGCHTNIQSFSVDRHNLFSLVAVGHGLTLTSEATTAARIPGIVYRPVANEVLPFSAIWSPRNDNPALRRLLSMARQMSTAAVS